MNRYIALLRAINVGGHTVKMDRLRALFAELGFSTVETFIASGNVIFEAEEGDARMLEQQIERHLQRSLGYPVATFLRTPAELAAVVAHRPFADAELEHPENYLYIGFLPAAPGDAGQRVLALRNEVDDFHIHGRELYWLCRRAISQSAISGAQLEKALGMPGTLRNVTTVRKLAARYPEA